MSQYVKGHIRDSIISKRKTLLYIFDKDGNRSGYCVFKLDTKQHLSIIRVTLIPIIEDFDQGSTN